MSELFIELFSEEVPAKLQVKAREQLKEILSNFFEQHGAKYCLLYTSDAADE